MKTRMELSCTEDQIHTSIHEVHAMMQPTDLTSLELKVFHDPNRLADKGHSWLTIYKSSYPPDLIKIYELQKRLRELLLKES